MKLPRRSFLPLAAGTLALVPICASLAGAQASAAEIKLLFPGAMVREMKQLLPDFQQSSGHKVTYAPGNIFTLTDRIKKGESSDVVIVSNSQIDELIVANRVLAGSKVEIARVGAGLFVGKGAPRPDISSVDAFKSAMLAAKSVAYTDPKLGGPVGIYIAGVFDQLGIGPEMKSKTKLTGGGVAINDSVLKGEAEIGFTMINEIVADPRIDLVGPLPAPIQNFTEFAAGQLTQQEANKALIAFLTSPPALAVMTSNGFASPTK